MNEHDPLHRDELVAAYLDGEATPTERAQVEADPELMARADLLRQVADMVAEPVMPPPTDVKRAHIAAALAASSTADNVTSLATKQRQMDWTRLGAIAAVILAVLAVPIVLLRGGDDDDGEVATAVEASDDGAASADESARDGAMEFDAATASDDGDGEEASDDGGDDGAESFSDDAMAEGDDAMIESEPEQEFAAEPPLATPGAVDDDAAEEAEEESDDAMAEDLGARRVDLPPVADDNEIGAVLEDAIAQAREGFTDDLNCRDEILAFIDEDPTRETVAGTVTIGGVDTEYVARLGDDTLIVRFDASCAEANRIVSGAVITGN